MRSTIGILVLGIAVCSEPAWAAHSESYRLDQTVVNSAGSTRTTASRQIHDSVGEAAVGQSYGRQYSVQAGFFHEYFLAMPTATITPTVTPTSVVMVSSTSLKVINAQISPGGNAEALIRWSQPNSAPTTVTIHSLAGEKVRTLADGQVFGAGQYHELRWDGKNTKGRMVASGIYIAHVRTEGYTSRAKIAVVK